MTKDTGLIWLGKCFAVLPRPIRDTALKSSLSSCAQTANFAVVAGAYAFAFLVDADDDDESDAKQPAWLKFVYKSLDFGSGRERGARK